MWKMIPTANGFWKPGCEKDISTERPSGTTSIPSMPDDGEAELTWFMEDSLAKTLARPESGPDLMETAAASGGRCLDAFGKWDPDTSLLRTFQGSLLEDKPAPWLESFPVSGTIVSGIAYRLPPLVPRTSVGGGGVLPTPVKGDGERASKNYGRGNLTLLGAQEYWPTPDVPNGGRGIPKDALFSGNTIYNKDGKKVQLGLENAVRFPTPQTTDAPDGYGPPNKNANTTLWNGANSLGQMAKQGLWPTPKGSPEHYGQPRENDRGDLQAAVLWPTPQAHDTGAGDADRVGRFGTEHDGRNLNDEVQLWRTRDGYSGRGAPQDPEKRKEGGHSVNLQDQTGGQLNPVFVCWLMGLPKNWTALNPHEIMGDSPNMEDEHARPATETDPDQTLPRVPGTDGPAEIQWQTGRLGSLYETCFLQPPVYGALISERGTYPLCDRQAQHQESQGLLRELWSWRETRDASQGLELAEQRPFQLNNALQFLSHIPSPPAGRHQSSQAEAAMLCLRQAFCQTWIVQYPSDTVQGIWQSLSDEEKEWTVICACYGGWWAEWPGVPRVATGIKDRVNRLKMGGNGIVPDCPAALLRGLNR